MRMVNREGHWILQTELTCWGLCWTRAPGQFARACPSQAPLSPHSSRPRLYYPWLGPAHQRALGDGD